MTFKAISPYRVAFFKSGPKAGKSDIVVVFEDGGQFTFGDLSPETAHHLL